MFILMPTLDRRGPKVVKVAGMEVKVDAEIKGFQIGLCRNAH